MVSPFATFSVDPEEEPVVNVIVPVKIPVFAPVSVRVRFSMPVVLSDVDVTPPLIVPDPAKLGRVTVMVAVSLILYWVLSNSIQVVVVVLFLNKISVLPVASFQVTYTLLPTEATCWSGMRWNLTPQVAFM